MLEKYGLLGKYAIEIIPEIPAISTGFPTTAKPGRIKIPADRKVSEQKLRALVAHEIECQ